MNRPKFGLSFPAKIFRAVDFPIPLVPTNPKTCPGLGTGSLEAKTEILFVLKTRKGMDKSKGKY